MGTEICIIFIQKFEVEWSIVLGAAVQEEFPSVSYLTYLKN